MFTVGRLPPWRIQDLQQHYKINLLSLAALFILFYAVQRIATTDDRSLVSNGYAYVGAISIFLLAGIIVRFFNANESRARKLTNRWSTFFIVSFGYGLLIIFGVALIQTAIFMAGWQWNFILAFNQLPIFASDAQGLATISGLVTLAATAILWTRTWRLFPDFRALQLSVQGALALLAWLLLAIVFWIATFVV